MDNLKKYIKETFRDKNLYILAIVTFLFFGAFNVLQYAPDTYSVFTNSTRENILHFFSCGRIATGIFFAVFIRILNFSDNTIYIISYIMAIVFTIASLYRLYKLLKKDIKNETMCMITSILIVINVFSLELFVYIEKGILMLSVFLCIISVEQLRKFFEGSKKSIIWAVIWMLIANCCYQGTVGLFVAISLVYIIKYSNNVKEFIKNNIIVALTYGIPAVINFAMVRFIFTNSRVKGEIILMESLKKIAIGIKNMLVETCGLFPKYLFLIILTTLIIWLIYKIMKDDNKKTRILEILYIIIGTIFIAVAPQILQDTNSIWLVPRSIYPAASLIGILLFYALSRFHIEKKELNVITIISVIIFIIQFIYFNIFIIDNYIVNYEDKQNSIQISELMNKYEEETGTQITKIAFYQDQTPSYTYSGIKASGDINIKALYPNWSARAVINYYTNRNLVEIEKNENIEKDFKEKNWNYFDNEQVLIVGDTLHLCIY